MKDKSDTIRGACESCQCDEYILLETSNKCKSCNCTASQHRQLKYIASEQPYDDVYEERSNAIIFKSTIYVVIWAAITLILGTQASNYRVPIDRGSADLAYLIGAAAIWSTFFVSFLTSFSQCREKRVLGHLMYLTLGVVGTTFLIFFYRATPQLVGFQGHPVDLARMIEWTRSCPALALLIGHVTRASPNKIWRAEMNSFILMVFGTLAAIAKEPLSEICGILAVSFHYMAMYDIYDMFGDAISGRTGSKYDVLSLQWARGATMFSWNALTVVFFMVRYEYLGYEAAEWLYIGSELVAKVVFGGALLSSAIDSRDGRSYSPPRAVHALHEE